MVTIDKKLCYIDGAPVWASECTGLSTDEKPTNVANASLFLEMDTGNIFAFDAAGKQWLPL